MRPIVLLMLLSLPAWGMAQSRCQSIMKEGDRLVDQNNIPDALTRYFDALNCDRSLRSELEPKIRRLFQRITNQKNSLAAANKKNVKLLKLFFPDGEVFGENGLVLDTAAASWVQGPEGKYAVINANGTVLPATGNPYIWETPLPFHDGTAIAKKGGEYYFIDQGGNIVLDEGFDFLHETVTDLMFGIQRAQKPGVNPPQYFPIESVIDPVKGKKRLRVRMLRTGFDRASEDFFPFKEDEKWGLMNADGEVVAEPTYLMVSKVYEGYAQVQSEAGWAFMDTTGTIRADWGQGYDQVGRFADNVAWTQRGEEFQLIVKGENGSKKEQIPGKSLVEVYETYFKYSIDKGEWKKEFNDEQPAEDFGPPEGQIERIQTQLAGVSIFEKTGEVESLSLFQRNDKYGLMGPDYQPITGLYDKIVQHNKLPNIFRTTQRSQQGLLIFANPEMASQESQTGPTPAELVRQLPNDFEDIGAYTEIQGLERPFHYVRVKQNGKWGYFCWTQDEAGNDSTYLIAPKYDLATKFFKKDKDDPNSWVARIYVDKFQLYFYINLKGEMLTTIERDKIW